MIHRKQKGGNRKGVRKKGGKPTKKAANNKRGQQERGHGPTVDHGNMMSLLERSAVDVDRKANERVHMDIVDATLQVQLEVFALVAVEGTIVHYDADFLRKPARGGPQHLGIGAHHHF